MTLIELYGLAHEIPEKLQYYNKYTWLAYNQVIDCKYLDINDIITHETPVNQYITEHGVILLFPNIINGQIVDIFVRSINTTKSNPLKLGSTQFPFGIGNLKENFKYGDTLVLVEGIGDLGTLNFILPEVDVISVQSNALSKNHTMLLSQVTNNFIILFDNDTAGIKGANITKNRLERLGCNVKIAKQYGKLKDTGNLLEILITHLKQPNEELKKKLKMIIKYYRLQLN